MFELVVFLAAVGLAIGSIVAQVAECCHSPE